MTRNLCRIMVYCLLSAFVCMQLSCKKAEKPKEAKASPLAKVVVMKVKLNKQMAKIPADSVVNIGDKYSIVPLVKPDRQRIREGLLEMRRVELSSTKNGSAFVSSGLYDDELIVVETQNQMEDGLRVKYILINTEPETMEPETASDYVYNGRQYSSVKNYEKADEYFEKAVSLDHNDMDAEQYYDMATAYHHDMRKFDKSIKMFQKALRLDPWMDRAYVEMACAYKDKGDCDTAIRLSKTALSLNPKSEHARYVMANAFLRKGKLGKAIRVYEKTIGSDPKSYFNLKYVYGCLCSAYYQNGDFDKAVAVMEKAVSINSTFDHNFHMLGLAHWEKGDKEKAAEFIKKSAQMGDVEAGEFLQENNII